MSEERAVRIMKGGFGFAVVFLIGWVTYGEVAPDWVLLVTAIVAFIVGILVYILNPVISGVDW